VQWKINKYCILWVWVFSLSYPACNVHAPCYTMWPVWLYIAFPHYLINGRILKKKVTEHKLCVNFIWSSVWDISHPKKNWVRCDHKCTLDLMWSARYSCQILMKVEHSRYRFEKYVNIEFHENHSSGNRVVPSGQKDRRRDMTKLTFRRLTSTIVDVPHR